MATPLLEVKQLQYSSEELIDLNLTVKKKEIIHQVSFTINHHEFVGLIGPNGSGKTTLSKLLTKIIEPSNGHILLDGVDYVDFRPSWKLHQEVSLVFQQVSSQFVGTDFITDLTLSLKNFGWSIAKIENRIKQLTKQLHLKSLIKRPFRELSGGQQQLLAIAEAIAVKPKLLILDEPTAQLDSENTFLVDQLLAKIFKEESTSILLISHKPIELSLAQKLLTLNQGILTGNYSTNEFLLDSSLLKENQLIFPATLAIRDYVYELTKVQLPLVDLSINSLIKAIETVLC